MSEKWRPPLDKTYHPVCEAFFIREIDRTLVHDVCTALVKECERYDMDTPIDERDVCLRADLLECLAYVSMFRLLT